jgi:hypothetical protein
MTQIPGCAIVALIFVLALVYWLGVPLVQFLDSFALTQRGLLRFGVQVLGVCVAGPAVIVMLGLSCLIVSRFFQRWWYGNFTQEYDTLGQLARYLGQTQAAGGIELLWTEENIFKAVQQIVAGIQGQLPKQITWNTRLE